MAWEHFQQISFGLSVNGFWALGNFLMNDLYFSLYMDCAPKWQPILKYKMTQLKLQVIQQRQQQWQQHRQQQQQQKVIRIIITVILHHKRWIHYSCPPVQADHERPFAKHWDAVLVRHRLCSPNTNRFSRRPLCCLARIGWLSEELSYCSGWHPPAKRSHALPEL